MSDRVFHGRADGAGDAGGGAESGGAVVIAAIGGFDPGGGAGVVRDFLTARTLGAVARLVPTAWTEQSAAGGVAAVEPRDPAALGRAVRAAAAGADAVKIGMLPDAAAAAAVQEALARFTGPVVVDPVLAASSGGALYRGDVAALLALAGRATLVTPNAGEAAALLGAEAAVQSEAEAIEAGRRLVAAGARAVLVKGGHLAGDEAVDLLVGPGGVAIRFAAPRVHMAGRASVRGTGCALATAIAVHLAEGAALADAVAAAKAWLRDRLEQAIDVGGGERHLP